MSKSPPSRKNREQGGAPGFHFRGLDKSRDFSVYSVCTERADMAELTGLQKQYILHWGEMGTRWGINRTVAQIHALLYLSPKALPAEEIAETLSVARSNVSTSIRELEG